MWSRVSWWLFVASERLYQILLHVYPREFRREYGPHMVQVFRDCCGDAAAQDGAAGVAKLWLHVLGDLSRSALNERAAALRTSTRRLAYAREGSRTMRLFRTPGREARGFDRFTKRARSVLQLAHEEACSFNQAYIGTEHILLGLIRERKGIGGQVLLGLGVTHDRAYAAVEHIVGKSQGQAPQNYDFTKPAITVMAHALEEAKHLHHGFIGTEHLLLGLLTTSGDAGRDAIDLLGVSPEQIQTRVMQMLQKEQSGR